MDSTKKHTNPQQILSICYGYGGLERGVSNVFPIKPVAYVEIEAFQNFNLVAAMESDLKDQVTENWTTPIASEVDKACKGQNQESLIKMALNGQLQEDRNNTTGKPQGQLNPEWVAQLMGTTLEQSFFVNMVTELYHKPQK